MAIRVRLIKVEYQVTWAEDDGDNLVLATGPVATALAADLDGFPALLRSQAIAWEEELRKRRAPPP